MKPMTNKERLFTLLAIVLLGVLVAAGNRFPWWVVILFTVAGLAGCRESFFGLEE